MAIPPLPNNIGKRITLRGYDHANFDIVDEIRREQSSNETKAIYLQKLRNIDTGGIEYRTAWYSLRPGNWWGFVNGTMMAPESDFKAILDEARQAPHNWSI